MKSKVSVLPIKMGNFNIDEIWKNKESMEEKRIYGIRNLGPPLSDHMGCHLEVLSIPSPHSPTDDIPFRNTSMTSLQSDISGNTCEYTIFIYIL